MSDLTREQRTFVDAVGVAAAAVGKKASHRHVSKAGNHILMVNVGNVGQKFSFAKDDLRSARRKLAKLFGQDKATWPKVLKEWYEQQYGIRVDRSEAEEVAEIEKKAPKIKRDRLAVRKLVAELIKKRPEGYDGWRLHLEKTGAASPVHKSAVVAPSAKTNGAQQPAANGNDAAAAVLTAVSVAAPSAVQPRLNGAAHHEIAAVAAAPVTPSDKSLPPPPTIFWKSRLKQFRSHRLPLRPRRQKPHVRRS